MPAATTIRNAPVYLKNLARLIRTAPAYMPQAIPAASSTPTSRPSSGQAVWASA